MIFYLCCFAVFNHPSISLVREIFPLNCSLVNITLCNNILTCVVYRLLLTSHMVSLLTGGLLVFSFMRC